MNKVEIETTNNETSHSINPMSAQNAYIQTLISENRSRVLKSPPKNRPPHPEPFIFVGTPKTYVLYSICGQCGQNKHWCICHVDQDTV